MTRLPCEIPRHHSPPADLPGGAWPAAGQWPAPVLTTRALDAARVPTSATRGSWCPGRDGVPRPAPAPLPRRPIARRGAC